VSAPQTVRLTIDGVAVEVPKGTGLVEAALAAGIEIPVFCYEPRLGPPVGACRMCLCEITPGPPKPQAACTLTAQDGMVVRTALTSDVAAEAQHATLEFILVNHPLDCPVCDKGGECPLQDLTFRYGPGNTRMTFPKRTFDKPIPVSPLIALDRERCILCYRCTRFSELVAEDGQLVAVNRGAASMIATFQDEPYRAPFSGNVIELCPVGALTSTTYRFEARPWEIQEAPTVCGLCPVGCNVQATTREGKVKRILSRNHPDVDRGWLCDKGRFAYGHLNASDRLRDPLLPCPAPGTAGDSLGARDRRGGASSARGRRPHRDRPSPGQRRSRRPTHSGSSCARGSMHTARSSRRRSRRHSTPSACLCRQSADAGRHRRARRRARRRTRADRRPSGFKEARRRGARVFYELDEDAVRARSGRSSSGRARAGTAVLPRRRSR
jgi:ferredoxin